MADVPTLIEAYSGGAQLLRDAMRAAAHVDLDARPIEGKWSIHEVVCHLADSEIVYADRIKRVIAEDNPTFFEADPELFGAALHWRRRPVDNELDVVEAIRRTSSPSCNPATPMTFSEPAFTRLMAQ